MSTFEEIRDFISEHSGIEKESVTGEAHLQEDLNLDTLGIADLVVGLEDKFQIKIQQEELVKFNTVSDIVDSIEDQRQE